MQVLVAEPSPPIANALRKFLEGVAEVQVAQFVDEAVQAMQARAPDVLIAAVSASFDGEVLCQQARKLPGEISVVLVYQPADVEHAPRRAHDAGADAFLVGPLKKHHVLSVTRAVWRLRVVQRRAMRAEAEARALAVSLAEKQAALERAEKKVSAKAVRAAGGVNTSDEAFFKKFMLIEVKRSRRYQYPVALLLVSLDQLSARLASEGGGEVQRAAIRAEALALVAELLRDVDLAMPFADDKYLVFLPHTHRTGAMVVAGRLIERLRRLATFPEGSASIGVASYDPKVEPMPQVSFGGLVRAANERLKLAQQAGGDRVEGPVAEAAAAATPASPKKSRISMG